MIRALALALLCCVLATVVACGQKGALKLPEAPPPKPAAP
ncbi:MAG: lipoprotein [Usitatibacter sp.]